jgi:hypothetical protein
MAVDRVFQPFSIGSDPVMTSSATARSPAERANGPITEIVACATLSASNWPSGGQMRQVGLWS